MDAHSRCGREECALTLATPQYTPTELQQAQREDEVLTKVTNRKDRNDANNHCGGTGNLGRSYELTMECFDLVETNLAAVSARQKSTYDVHSKSRTFTQGKPVWLSVPTRVKLDPKWEGGLLVKSVKGLVNVEVHTNIVHVN